MTFFSRVFKKFCTIPPLGHLNYNNMLVQEQFGFRKNLTTEKATYELINEFVIALNDTLIVGRIVCQLVKKKSV